MKILFLAPQPFFQERGTPIAVRLALQVLSARGKEQVDLLSYHEGSDIHIDQVTLHRISVPPFLGARFLKNVGPGVSLKKLACDFLFTIKAIALLLKARKKGAPYQLIHAVEEAVFIAWLVKKLFGVPYLYDMDSSLALQLTEKWPLCKPLYRVFEKLEEIVTRDSLSVVPVCDALAVIARKRGAKEPRVLHDISLLAEQSTAAFSDLRQEMGVPRDASVLLYIGNLERYQGVELLIESFARIAVQAPEAHVAVIGGTKEHVEFYRARAESLGCAGQVHMLGPRPVSTLGNYLPQATVLVSPRIKGNNTPMKIYSYLHAGVVLLATDLPTHTQVLDGSVAKLAPPDVEAYSRAMWELLSSPEERERIGRAARAVAEERYTFERFSTTLNAIYDGVSEAVEPRPVPSSAVG